MVVLMHYFPLVIDSYLLIFLFLYLGQGTPESLSFLCAVIISVEFGL